MKPDSGRIEQADLAVRYLFNSYYNALGEQFSRPQRGLLTRPACHLSHFEADAYAHWAGARRRRGQVSAR